ncbi:MAG TPA: formate dehydrogenase accessory sulfurtransferase FdhD, partial [Candidatus Sulfotelmatobacter sp.]|nr:formate dehydrogenase accessory sulfurtransferase FdhD [Candidatus Sulfotelmatobacter sp.]
MARRDTDVTQVREWKDGRVETRQDDLAAEEPLEIRVDGRSLTVTMRTPGNDFELAAGFLFTEGIVESADQIVAIREAPETKITERGNIVEAELSPDVKLDLESTQRNFFAASSCGICGKASIESVRRRGVRAVNPNFRMTPEILCQLPEKLKASQEVFSRTGGLHAAALFDRNGEMLAEREDIGRHNAVDKIIGWAVRAHRMPLAECALIVSGRGGFEIVQKAAVAGIPVVASVSACSSLAVRLAREVGMTLAGFLRGRRFVVYAGGERLG